MTTSARISYVLMAVLLFLVGWLHLATLLLTTFFGYFALHLFSLGRRKWLGVIIYIVVVTGIGFGLYYFSKQAYRTLPTIAEKTIPAVADFAQKKDIDLPFTDYEGMKTFAKTGMKDEFANVSRYARVLAVEVASLIIGLVVAISLFLNNTKWDEQGDPDAVKGSLYADISRELAKRVQTFYSSFARVIGAQITISAINTTLTAIFLFWNGFPYVFVIIGLTFLCGLLPIIGNLMSNTLIIGVAFTKSPELALLSLIFLVCIHKLEYFLNSKIIGDRIKNPMWLTLLGLVLGEKLMGIPGMILAPVVLHYIKEEASRNKTLERSPEVIVSTNVE